VPDKSNPVELDDDDEVDDKLEVDSWSFLALLLDCSPKAFQSDELQLLLVVTDISGPAW
jgi:hypothetical protein